MATSRKEALEKFKEYIEKHIKGTANQEFWLRQVENGKIFPKPTQERAGSPPRNYRMVFERQNPSNATLRRLFENYKKTTLKNAAKKRDPNGARDPNGENENTECSASGCWRRLHKHGQNSRWWGGRTRRNKK